MVAARIETGVKLEGISLADPDSVWAYPLYILWCEVTNTPINASFSAQHKNAQVMKDEIVRMSRAATEEQLNEYTRRMREQDEAAARERANSTTSTLHR